MSGLGLGASRVAYLVLVGLSFFGAAVLADPREMGVFAIASAYCGVAFVVLEFGVGRRILVELGERAPLRAAILRWRLPVTLLLLLAGTAAIIADEPVVAASCCVVLTRLAISDLENVLLALDEAGPVSRATLVNGGVTLASTLAAVHHGSAALLIGSSVGNLVAATLMMRRFLRLRRRAHRSTHNGEQFVSTLGWAVIWPFGLMGIIGVVYLRAGVGLLVPLGVSVQAAASYAIAFKTLEMLVALRGALTQRAVVSLVRNRARPDVVQTLGRRIAPSSVALSLIATIGVLALTKTELLGGYPQLWEVTLVCACSAPLIFAHFETSTWIFSQPGRGRFLSDSILLASTAVLLTSLAAVRTGVVGVMVVTCAMEYVSYLVFSRHYRGDWRKLRPRGALWPLVGCAPALSLVLISNGIP